MPTAAFHIDIREITRLADGMSRESGRITRNELTTAMDKSTKHVETAARARVNNKTGNYSRSFQRQTKVSASGVLGIITNAAKSATGFVYAGALEWGRGPVRAIKAKALRFEIGGRVIFAKSVGPAPAQHIMEFGLRDAEPRIQAEFIAAGDRIAARLERA